MAYNDVETSGKKKKSNRQCECCGLIMLILSGIGITIGLVIYFVLNPPGENSPFNDVVEVEYPVSSEYAAKNGREWLMRQQKEGMQWPPRSSADVVLALRLGAKHQYQIDTYQFQIAAKSMEIDLLVEEMKTSPPADVIIWQTKLLSKYVVALKAACMDPTNFHGVNLLNKLKSYYGTYSNFYQSNRVAMSWYALALCTSGHKAELTSSQIGVLSGNTGAYTFGVEEASMIAMALCCLNQSTASAEAAENYILGNRMADYSYGGDLQTTGLAVQALSRSNLFNNETKVDESKLYMSQIIQSNMGVYPSIGAASAVMPALNGHSFVNIRDICPPMAATAAPTGDIIGVKILVNGGVVNSTVNKQFQVRITKGQTLYTAMTSLAIADTSFTFTSTSTSNGQELYSVLGLSVNVNARQYWKVSKKVNGNYVEHKTSVSFIIPVANDEFKFEAATY